MIGLLHYHLRPGGVTRVIEAQAQLLHAAGQAFRIVSGEAAPPDFPFPVQVIPGLAYDAPCPDLASLAPDLTLWHFHNPTLGKNPSLLPRLHDLAHSGQRILLQIHDLAEDGRPHLFQNWIAHGSHPYPIAAHLHYAFINSRDQAAFHASGLSPHQSHYLGNPVRPLPDLPAPPISAPRVFYPVRAIRRKNLGELLLIALFAQKDAEFAVALAPTAPSERQLHDDWQDLAQELHLPIAFDVSNHLPAWKNAPPASHFRDWYAGSTHVISTSLAEGFGLGFFEALLANRPVFGRHLPEIHQDLFPQSLPPFYDSIQVLLTTDEFSDWQLARDQAWQRSGQAYARLTKANWPPIDPKNPCLVDFAHLPECLQKQVLRRLAKIPTPIPHVQWGEKQCSLSDYLAQCLGPSCPIPPQSEWLPLHSLSAYSQRLFKAYSELLASPTDSPISSLDPTSLLSHYLNESRFSILRS